MKNYDHTKIEKKWQKEWDTKKVYKTESVSKKKKFYVLDMFPYPSGAGLHVGHPRGYIGSDVYARMKRMQGYNVLHPMGYDAFGLPAEQYAIEHKIHPRKAVDINVATFEKQLSIIGLSYDWSRKVNTTDPAYYKWTQWIFLEIYNSWYDKTNDKARPITDLVKLFEKNGNTGIDAVCDTNFHTIFSAKEWNACSPKEKQEILMKYRLAYEGFALVNWCPKLGTVLANDEIVEDKEGNIVSERGGYPVEKLSMRQWFMRITAYADRLLTDLEPLNWSSHIKEIQKNWIGKSIGSEIEFPIVYTKNIKRKILIGTRNEAKFRMVKECLPDLPSIEFVSLNDIQPVDDSGLIEGMDYVENARMKSEFYYKATGLPTISLDNVLWLEKWKKDSGIMVHMRKEANPKSERASDSEVITFFQNWLKKVGGKSKAHFIYSVAFTDAEGTRNFNSIQREYTLQPKQSINFWPGYPTESLLIDAKTKEYKGDQSNEIRYSTLISDLKEYSEKWFIHTPKVKVFTTRADTLFGVTYIVVSPEHANIEELATQAKNTAEVLTYIREAKERIKKDQINEKEKTGIEIKGITAVNPANGEEVPVWVADYVLAGYGTGAVMAVPTHDERDYEFAKKYKLPIKYVVAEEKIDTRPEMSPREGLPVHKRRVIRAVVKHWSEDKYLILTWLSFGWKTFISGGIEENEDMIEAAKREVLEETGYKNLNFKYEVGAPFRVKFFAPNKNQNRDDVQQGLYFVLDNGEKIETSDHEKHIHTVSWITANDLEDTLKNNLVDPTIWDRIIKQKFYSLDDGLLINSGKFNDLTSEEAREQITKAVGGKIVTKFKMRDAIFARQRYWGEPIPLRHNKKDGITTALKIKELPLKLPNVTSYEPTGTGESPLAGVKSWVKEGYETNTMPGWAGSSWYFLRYMDPKNSKEFASKKALKYWKDVDMYVGGQEHATGHLLYSRFWHKFLYDMGYVPVKEPFKTLKNQGLIIATDGRKMSKRWGNVINPDEIVKTYGADTLRVYEMFMGPFEQTVSWSTESIIGSRRFIERVYRLTEKIVPKYKNKETIHKTLHKTIKKVTEDIETMSFNTAVSSMMVFLNEMDKLSEISCDDFKHFLQILSPFAPHISEELWRSLGEKKSIHQSTWPKWSPTQIIDGTMTIVVQVNGKVRAELSVGASLSQSEIEKQAIAHIALVPWLEGKTIRRIIYVPKRLINIVV